MKKLLLVLICIICCSFLYSIDYTEQTFPKIFQEILPNVYAYFSVYSDNVLVVKVANLGSEKSMGPIQLLMAINQDSNQWIFEESSDRYMIVKNGDYSQLFQNTGHYLESGEYFEYYMVLDDRFNIENDFGAYFNNIWGGILYKHGQDYNVPMYAEVLAQEDTADYLVNNFNTAQTFDLMGN